MVVSPTYYGIVSDIESIAKVCHDHGAMLLVDEAHGAHCYFSDKLPDGAIQLGADMCVQSLHKTAGALTQSSILHVKSGLADLSLLEANLRLVQSTSPSYILMTSIDAARRDLALHGEAMAKTALKLAEYARDKINSVKGLRCAGKELVGTAGIFGMDLTRLTISAADLGLSGFELKDLLFEEYNIDLEMADDLNILAIVTFANTIEDMQRLVEALKEIAEKYAGAEPLPAAGKTVPLPHAEKMPPLPEYVISPREAYFAEKKRIPWKDALGKVSAEMIAPYPPGIPVICPGERISEEAWSYIENVRSRKGHMHGPSDPYLDSLLITE
jgi:arginine/lysine/ornithine decarboxylase